jgi:branched-chain amino acid transport system permease protein
MEPAYRISIGGRFGRLTALGGAAILALFVSLPAFAGRATIEDLIFVFYMLALAQYWNLLAGYAGLISVGQQAFVGLGGYMRFALTVMAGLDPLIAIVLAGVIAGLLALPTAFVVFRLNGAYFAIGTWVVAEVDRLVFAQWKQLGGGTGTSLPPEITNTVFGIEWVKALFDVRTSAARDMILYWSALALAVGTILAVYLILRSRHGLALAAIRDSEPAAASAGVDNFRTKLVPGSSGRAPVPRVSQPRHRTAVHPSGHRDRPRGMSSERGRHDTHGVRQDTLLQRPGPEQHSSGSFRPCVVLVPNEGARAGPAG